MLGKGGSMQGRPSALASCASEACPCHAPDAGCRVALGVRAEELAGVYRPVQAACPLLGWLVGSLSRHRRVSPAGALRESPFLGEVVLVLDQLSTQKGPLEKRVDHRYLLRAVLNHARSRTRETLGRHVCGNCLHYLASQRLCGHRSNSYGPDLPPDAVPSRLAPRCDHFSSRRAQGGLPGGFDREEEVSREAEVVWAALDRLRESEPGLHALVVAIHIEGASRIELASRWRVHRKTIERREQRAFAALRHLIEDLP
jgi:hypothetical protein